MKRVPLPARIALSYLTHWVQRSRPQAGDLLTPARLASAGYGQRDKRCDLYIGPAAVTCPEICCTPSRASGSGPAASATASRRLGAWLRNVSAAGVSERSQARRTPNICASPRVGTTAASSTDQPVRGGPQRPPRGAVRQLTGSWSRPGHALDHERSGNHRCAQAVTVMATRPSR
jgi:hypothetical protein